MTNAVDAFYDDRLLWVDHQISVRATVVAKEALKWNRDLAVCKALSLTPCAVLGNAAAFFLSQGGHDGQQQFAFAIECPDVLFFKIDLNTGFLELADGGQAVYGVSGKSADRLGDDEVNFAVQRIGNHLLEAFAALGAGSGNTFIGVDVDVLPIVTALDVVGVIINLCFVAGELVVVVSGNTSVGAPT